VQEWYEKSYLKCAEGARTSLVQLRLKVPHSYFIMYFYRYKASWSFASYFVCNTIYSFWFWPKSFWFTDSTHCNAPNCITEAGYYSPREFGWGFTWVIPERGLQNLI